MVRRRRPSRGPVRTGARIRCLFAAICRRPGGRGTWRRSSPGPACPPRIRGMSAPADCSPPTSWMSTGWSSQARSARPVAWWTLGMAGRFLRVNGAAPETPPVARSLVPINRTDSRPNIALLRARDATQMSRPFLHLGRRGDPLKRPRTIVPNVCAQSVGERCRDITS